MLLPVLSIMGRTTYIVWRIVWMSCLKRTKVTH